MGKLLTNILSSLLIVICSLNTKAQSQSLDSPLIEIFTLVEGNSSQNGDISFTLSNIGTAWKAEPYSTTENLFYLSDEVGGGTVTPTLNAPYNHYTGFNYSSMDDHIYPEFGFGLYKIQTSLGNYFYLDYRDTRYAFYNNCSGHCADIWIKYDIDTQGLYLKSHGTDNWSSYSVENGAYLKIWDIKGQSSHSTIGVPNFWQNCLVVVKVNEQWPHLIWGKYPVSNVNSYTLYRGLVTNGIVPPESNFVPINTSGTTTFDFEDIDEEHISPINWNYFEVLPYIALYYVKAKQGTQELERTNIVSVFSNIGWTNSILLTQENNHPKIMWGDYHETTDEVSGYRIRKRLTVSSVPSVDDILIEKGKNVNEFVDNDFLLNTGIKPKDYVSYSVEAILANSTPATKIVSTKGSSSIQWKKNDNAEAAVNNQFRLSQNTPNPFNPSTTISYQIPTNTFV